MRHAGLLVLALAVVHAGCGTAVTWTPLNPVPHDLTTRTADQVEVFASGPPARRHVDVAVIQSQPRSSSRDNRADALAKLRARAAAFGCDAVVITGYATRDGLFATCIVYDDAPPVHASAAVAADDDDPPPR